ncbi:acyl-CoA--sterol O-acyltransferase 1 [Ricinus communis]|uniref:acyl-CoA--sterol O-acyltransferase 1 n=1 Tax=Ricinus communis TaxID=3988 RepID=UPI00201A3346|nr:acyl-CoA--sterol O-acyltransferase 1 [Ricinus communis]
MEGEIQNFIWVWITVFISLCYCYAIGKFISKGTKRLLFILPVVCFFLYLPLNLFSPHLGGTTAFFIAWLANFKLLLFAFGKGPLSSDPSISLPLFTAVSCLPIKIQKENPSPKSYQNGHNPQNSSNPSQNSQIREDPSPRKLRDSFLNYAIKGILVAVMVRVYDYSDHIHPRIILFLYAFHIYFLLELNLAITAALARTLLGIELEPQFNEPYLSTSLQDFWGKRWNLMVTSILRPTVYEPTRNIFSRAIGRKWATLPAVFGTFVVSALMHELMFYYLGRTTPTGDISVFFLLHGFCLTAEIAFKKWLNGRWQLPGLVSGILTVGFVMSTGFWLFFPNFMHSQIDVRAFEDYATVVAFLKNTSENVMRF